MGIAEELKLIIRTDAQKAIRNLKKFKGSVKKTEDSMSQMGKVAMRAGGMILGAFGARQILNIGRSMVQAAADIETAAASFEVLLGSAGAAADIMDDIQRFSASTPFRFEELAGAAKRMLAFGTAEQDVIDKMEQLGNLAQGNSQVLDRLTNAYGKVQAKGRASLEELNMFTEAGVPIMKELARQYDVTSGEMFKLIEGGKVGFAEIDAAVEAMSTGTGQFAGMLQKQSETLNGMMSTLQDNIKRLGAELGQSVLPGTKTWVGLLNKGLMLFNDSRAAQRTYQTLLEKSNTEQLTFQEELRKIEAQRNWYSAAQGQMDEDRLIYFWKGKKYYQWIVDEQEILNEQIERMNKYQGFAAEYADAALIARREEAMLLGEEADALFELTEEEKARLKLVKGILEKHQATTRELEKQRALAVSQYYVKGLEEMKGIIEDDMSELERLEAQLKRLSAMEWKPDQTYQVEIRAEALAILERQIAELRAQEDELNRVVDSHEEIVNYSIAAQELLRLGGKSLRAQNAAAAKRVQLAAAAAREEKKIAEHMEWQAKHQSDIQTALSMTASIMHTITDEAADWNSIVFDTTELILNQLLPGLGTVYGETQGLLERFTLWANRLFNPDYMTLDEMVKLNEELIEAKENAEEMEHAFSDTGEGFGEMVDGMMHDLDDVLRAIGETYDEELYLLQHLLDEGMIGVEEYLRRLGELKDWKAGEEAGAGGGGGSTNIASSGGLLPPLPAASAAPAGAPTYSLTVIAPTGNAEEIARVADEGFKTLDRRRRL